MLGVELLLLAFWLLPGSAVTLIVGLLVCLFAALSYRWPTRSGDASKTNHFEKLVQLARDEEVSACHLAILESHLAFNRNPDPIYWEFHNSVALRVAD
jgi:hypothetical protein